MSEDTSMPSGGQQISSAQSQRNALAHYLGRVDALAASVQHARRDDLRHVREWARRELELATLRLYASSRDFVDEMAELMREIAARINGPEGEGK